MSKISHSFIPARGNYKMSAWATQPKDPKFPEEWEVIGTVEKVKEAGKTAFHFYPIGVTGYQLTTSATMAGLKAQLLAQREAMTG